VLVVGDEALATELLQALRHLGLDATAARTAEGVHAVVQDAPDLVVLVGSARRGGAGQLLEPLSGQPGSAVVPVVLLGDTAELPALGAPQRAFTQGVVGRVQRELGAAGIAAEVQRILRDLPERSNEARGVVAEATLDELVDLLSRELQSGVLSVHGEREAKIVLRAGRPVSGSMDAFVDQVRPMLAQAEAPYAFVSHPAPRIDSLPPLRGAPRPDALDALRGTRLLVVHEDRSTANAWAKALQHHGAQVRCLTQGSELDEARRLDPQVLIVEAAAIEGRGSWLLSTVQREPRLRWAATLVVPEVALHNPSHDELYLDTVAEKVNRLTEPHRELARQAQSGQTFETRLELIGPAQLLRVLCESRRSFALKIVHPNAHFDVLVSAGEVLEVRGLRRDRGTQGLEGREALSLICELRSGRVTVQGSAGYVRRAPGTALSFDSRDLGRPSPLPSHAPEPLVSSIPPPPRIPSGRGTGAIPMAMALRPRSGAALGLTLAALAVAIAGLVTYVVWM